MAIQIGQQLGPYEITSPLGEGGMGIVYRARDTKLERDVAIKALPGAFADDSDRLQRFQREAQVLASLICLEQLLIDRAARYTVGCGHRRRLDEITIDF